LFLISLMKILSVSLFLWLFSAVAFSQGHFYGSYFGGFGDGGKIFKFNADGSGLKVIKTFNVFGGNGYSLYQSMPILGSDNKLYGVTHYGGLYDKGIIYSIDRTNNQFIKLHDFELDIDGAYDDGPYGKLAEGSDGYIYGYVERPAPVIYKIKKDGSNFTKLTAPFPLFIQRSEQTGMIKASDGNLYGVATVDQSSLNQFVFRLTPAGVFTKIKTLGSYQINGSLIQGSDGKLYGSYSSSNSTMYSMDLNGNSFQTITLPARPISTLIEGPASMLYGVAYYSSGAHKLFKIKTDGTGYTDLYSFTVAQAQTSITTQLAIENNMIFGTLRNDTGDTGNVIYKIGTDGSGYTVLAQLTKATGRMPNGVLVTPDHVLYAANYNQGSTYEESGSIVKVNTDGSGFAVVRDFTKNFSQEIPDGSTPINELTLLPDGKLLGACSVGGTKSDDVFASGLLFTIDQNDVFKVIFEFDNENTGGQPINAPILGPDNFYYGVATFGGVNKRGTIYKVKSDGTGFQKLHDFSIPTLSEPGGGVVFANGRLYGSASYGGTNDEGGLWGIDPDGNNYQVILNFDGTNGQAPFLQTPVFRNDGFLYFQTDGGANNKGLIFKIKPDGSGYTKLFDFDATDYNFPTGVLRILDNGDMITSGLRGGTNDLGAILSVHPNGSFDVLHSFDDVILPESNWNYNQTPFVGPDGKLWGLEPNGGSNGTGIVYKMDPDGSNYTKIQLNITSNSVSFMFPWGGLNYFPDTTPPGKLAQTVTFPEQQARTFGDPDFDVNATASSGLPVVYDASDNISINGKTVTMLRPGRAYVFAWAEENATYKRSEIVEQDFCINPPEPVITVSGNTLISSNETGNQWFLNGTKIKNATDQSYGTSLPGTYTVQTTIENCPSVVSAPYTISIVLGLEEEMNSVVNISPNPAIDEIFITTSTQSTVSLIDIAGRVLGTYVVSEAMDRIDVGSLSKGLYFLRIETNNGLVTKAFSKL